MAGTRCENVTDIAGALANDDGSPPKNAWVGGVICAVIVGILLLAAGVVFLYRQGLVDD